MADAVGEVIGSVVSEGGHESVGSHRREHDPAGPLRAPATSTPPPPPAGSDQVAIVGGGTHVVQPGETMTSVAERHYGDGSKWHTIAKANPQIGNPDVVRSGEKLTIPEIARPTR